MPIRVSVLGPQDLVNRIIEEGTSFKSLTMTAYAYKNETETMQLINSCINQTDLILFTGPIPYYIARRNVENDIPMLYVSYSGTAFYKALFNYMSSERWNKSKTLRFSVDTMHKNVVEEMLEELNITDYEIYASEHDDFISSNELAEYHINLYKDSKTDFMITCLTSAYEKLKLAGMPAYRIVPTVMSIRETLRMANLEAQNLISKKAQLCVGVVKILNWGEMDNYTPSEYEQRRMKLAVMEHFINFCEGLKASMKFEGEDEYIFYATRGAIENVTNYYRYMPVIQDITEQLPLKVCIGLGYGYSANEAEKNSREALEYAKNYNKNCCYVIMEDRKVRGPLEGGRIIEFYSRAQDSKVAILAEESNLSAMTINKVIGVMESYSKDTITAVEIAETLNITLRSARRILSNFEQAGIAKIVGEEQPAGRGRPRQIYKIVL
jgi:hypothetical protein